MAERPKWNDAMRLTAYYNCRSQKPHLAFLRFPKRVLEVQLQVGPETLLSTCDESVRYKIRRAQREGVTSEIESDRDTFMSFYNVFADSKGLEELDSRQLSFYWPSLTVTKAMHLGAPLAMHAYMVDAKADRATLLYSCSHFRNAEDSKTRNFLGNASRFLYWDDMRRFSDLGIKTFDFGYFGNEDQISQVNQFKKGYPCEEKNVSTYISLPLYCFMRLTRKNPTF